MPAKPEAARRREEPSPKRLARIVQPLGGAVDDRERERERLLGRVLNAEGRSAVTRSAGEYSGAGFEFPREQAVQLKLLEHLSEDVIRSALGILRELLASEPVSKRPVLEQRLKRVEDSAEEQATRELASELRRSLRG